MSRRSDIALRHSRRSYIDWVKKQLKEIKEKEGTLPPTDKLVIFVMSHLDVARRTAKEYLEVALSELESESK
jgi:hypothetical protein